MPPALASAGLLFCGVFLVTEAVRAVYFGGIFQQASSFIVGSLVFGTITTAVLAYTCYTNRAQLALAWSMRRAVIRANLLTAISWTMYFFAIQMIEPAVVYTVFSGTILMTMLLAARSGVVDEEIDTNRVSVAGYKGIALALTLLAISTLLGFSGFVRGTSAIAALGLCLATGAGATIAYAMIVCKRLDERGLAPLTQLGLRFVVYIFLGGALGMLGVDSKGEIAAPRLAEIVALAIVLTGVATYAVQRAVSLLTSQALGAASAFGPCLVFGLQIAEGRVDFTPTTLIGVCLYCLGALLVSLGPLLSFRRLHVKTSLLQ